MTRYLFSFTLGLTAAVLLSTLAGWLVPGLYGSCFEGSCGYVQAFIVVPLLTLLAWGPVHAAARRFGPLLSLLLVFPFAWLLGMLLFEEVGGYGVPLLFVGLGVRRYREHQATGQPWRTLFLQPVLADHADRCNPR